MAIKGRNTKWLTMPLVALFILFSTGAAAAPDCHIELITPPTIQSEVAHSHSAHPHTQSNPIATTSASNPLGTLLSVGSTLGNEICVVVGFTVLLFLRFARTAKSIPATTLFSPQRYQLPYFLSNNLGYLNLNHLQLGIIRI